VAVASSSSVVVQLEAAEDTACTKDSESFHYLGGTGTAWQDEHEEEEALAHSHSRSDHQEEEGSNDYYESARNSCGAAVVVAVGEPDDD